jgi:DTW domain-containing protein YfiP
MTTSGLVPATPRAMCARCRRPTSVCYCAAIPRLETTTRVVILQHPNERDMPIGTAHMASLSLPAARLFVGQRWDEDATLRAALADPAYPPILLYPGPGARDILAEPPPGPVTLVVVDGTWWEAKSVIRDNPILRALPRYAFVTPEPSQYRIRREPTADVVSTIEALAHVLGALEGDRERFRALFAPLHAMVDAHLRARAASPAPRYRTRVPRPPSEKLPAAVRERYGDLVCVVGEANAWPYAVGKHEAARAGAPGRRTPARPAPDDDGDELVHWVAHRPSTGETLDLIARPEKALSPTTPFHLGLTEAALREAPPRAELLARFADFVRPTDVVCAWGAFGLRLFLDAGGALPAEKLDLRTAAQRLHQRTVGTLEAYATSVAPGDPTLVAAGRAGLRATLLARVIDAWRALP